MTDMERILAEQRAARDHILAGNDDQFNRLWLADWVAEEILTLTDDPCKRGTIPFST